jgi:hypothetical protein
MNDAERRVSRLAWWLDNSIPLPGGYRMGIEGLLGLIPGVGDALSGLLSAYIVFEARRAGAPVSLLLRMAANVTFDAVVGTVPLLGDLFDIAFKANIRNLGLLSAYLRNPVRERRSNRIFASLLAVFLILLMAAVLAIPVILVLAIMRAFG